MNLRAEYDLWHNRVYEADPWCDDSLNPWYLLVDEHMGDVTGLSVLEIACGRGGYIGKLVKNGAFAIGCDFSSAAIRAAILKLKDLGFQNRPAFAQGDAQQLPFAADSFDIVISCETIEHVPNVQSALRAMHRVTKPGGKLLLTTPNYFNAMGLYELYARLRHPRRRDDQPFDRRQWFAQVRAWVRRAGWRIIRADGTVHQFPFVPGRNPVRWEGLEANRGMRRILSPFAYTYFVMAEKAR